MSIALFVNAQNNWLVCNEHAWQLTRALLQKEHTIEGIFFYGQSVQLLTNSAVLNQWTELSKQHHINVLACSTMLQQQHLISQAEEHNFPFAGMASWVQWSERATQVVELN